MVHDLLIVFFFFSYSAPCSFSCSLPVSSSSSSRCVSLSEAKVLKKPEGNNGIAPLLQSLGMKQKSNYPSPMEFAR